MPAAVGLFLPQIRMDFATIEERVRAAEEAGFHSVWFMDHLAPPVGRHHDCLEAWTLVSAVAVRTSTIRLGHLVLCDPFRHPAVLAKMAATVDVISGGRLELGLGWGSVEDELRSYGFGPQPPAVRSARLGETLEVIEALFTGEPVTYSGRYVTLMDAIARPRPVAGRIPIHLGGGGRRLTLPLVSKYADWWNCPSYAVANLDELRPLVGPGVRVSVQHPIGLAGSRQALATTAADAQRRFGSWGGLIVGTPDEVAAALRAELESGVELFVLQFSDFGTPATIDLFAREVAPALA